MHTEKRVPNTLEDTKVNVKLTLASLWISFMFLYIYVDYFHLYMPGSLQDMLAGKVFMFDVTQTFLLTVLISVTIPTLMIFLSLVLPAKVNRLTNIVVAILYIPYTLTNLVGEAWIHMMLAALIEVILLGFVIRSAWTWPRIQVANNAYN